MNETKTADWQRADELFEALRKLCGATTKQEAEDILAVSRHFASMGTPEANEAIPALEVLLKHWPEENPIPGE